MIKAIENAICKYGKIAKHRKNLMDSCVGIDDECLREMYSIDVFFEAKTYETYELFADFCKRNNYKRVFDIGCAFGFQSEIFLNEGIGYVGINDGKLDFWNKEIFEYIVGTYPFKIKADENDLAVSSLCLFWNCYLYEGEKTLKRQCEALTRDFKSCLLYMPIEKLDFVKSFFKKYQIINENIVYL